MFASISRRSSRIRKPYICSSCLCNIAAHTSPPISNHERTTHLGGTSQPFSTSTANSTTKKDSAPSKVKDAEPAEAGRPRKSPKLHKSTQAVVKRERRSKAQSLPPSSNATTAIKALRAAKLAKDAALSSSASANKSVNGPRKQVAKVAAKKDAIELGKPSEKPAREPKTKPSTHATASKTVSLRGRKKGKLAVNSSVAPETSEQSSITKPREKLSRKASVAKAKPAFKVTRVRAKSRLVAKTFQVTARRLASSADSPVLVRKVQSGEAAVPENLFQRAANEDPSTILAIVKAFATELDGTSSGPTGPSPHAKRVLVDLIQSGKLSGDQRLEAIKLLRHVLLEQPTSNSSSSPPKQIESKDQSLKQALLSKATVGGSGFSRRPNEANPRNGSERSRIVRDPPGPVKIAKGTTSYEIKTLDPDELDLVPLESDGIEVPKLAYGLDRVLFNPGVYQLQDPRSKVYNFDPYLQEIMPASEFDFTALAPYITSSRDQTLLGKARENGKKYTGSTSSMTSALAHFHFLLSAWRPINTGNLSKEFPVEYQSFTALQRAPNAIFLRNRDGVYAIDADKQYDSGNILMMLGKSMEKVLTMPTAQFEKYRKGNSHQISEEERNAPESFHYTTIGDFLLRSQLDAYDPRLPGSGMFDLKTRAVIAVRMDAEQYEEGRGYQIRSRQGEWESYEREYFDMIRAAFLKYSLQVRMGRMDGIFVAFHNTTKIFGFQYISLPEMDLALHGTEDTTLGDNEFKLSLELLNRVLDRATIKYPGKSLRLHFETRDATTSFMYIFAEPVEEERIEQIQATNKAKIEEFERKVCGLAGQNLTDEDRKAEWDNIRAEVADSMEMDEQIPDELEDAEGLKDLAVEGAEPTERGLEDGATAVPDVEALSEQDLEEMEKIVSSASEKTEDHSDKRGIAEADNPELESSREPVGFEASGESQESGALNAENKDAAEESEGEQSHEVSKQQDIIDEDLATTAGNTTQDDASNQNDSDTLVFTDQTSQSSHKEVLGMTLTIRNKLNGEYIERPRRLDNEQKWEVEYALEEMGEASTVRHYASCLKRRKNALHKTVDLAEVASWNDLFIKTIKRLSDEGRLWREREDEKERGLPIKTLYPVDGKTITERVKKDEISSEVTETGEKVADAAEPAS